MAEEVHWEYARNWHSPNNRNIYNLHSDGKYPVRMAKPQDTGPVSGPQPQPPYSAFHPWQKRWIIAVVAFGGWFSSLSRFKGIFR